MPLNLPDGTTCFLDANIVYYHFVTTPPLSEGCTDLLKRVAQGHVIAFTSVHVLAEAIHKIMLTEASSRFLLPRAKLVNWMQQHPDRVSELDYFRKAAEGFPSIGVRILQMDLQHLVEATQISQQVGLLTNDAITVALMKRQGIVHLVTNDDDFVRVPGITVWQPR